MQTEDSPPFSLGDLVEQVDDFYPERQAALFLMLDSGEHKHGRWYYRVFILDSTDPQISGRVLEYRFTARHIIEECVILSRL